MNSLSTWKIPADSAALATLHCCFHNKITIFEFSPSSSSTSHICVSSPFFRRNSGGKSFRNGRRSSAAEIKPPVSVAVQKPRSINANKPFWKKLAFGSKKFRSIVLLNVVCVVYASNIAVIKDVEAFTDPAYFSAVRFAVSTIPFLPFIFQARKDAEIRNSGLELGLWVSLGYLSEALGLVTSDAARASFISLFTIIAIPMIESMLGEIVPARTWFGILMSVVGIFMLECSGSPPDIGDLFNFLSAIFFGIHTLRTEHISRTTGKEKLFALLGYEVGVVAVLSTIWCAMGSNLDGISWSWDWVVAFPWLPALYTGVFSTGLCLWGEIAAMREVSATETAVIYGLEPVWGAGFAWFVLGERWGVAGWIGAALILGGSLTVQMLGAWDSQSGEAEEDEASEKNTLSASPLMVRSASRDNGMDVLKK